MKNTLTHKVQQQISNKDMGEYIIMQYKSCFHVESSSTTRWVSGSIIDFVLVAFSKTSRRHYNDHYVVGAMYLKTNINKTN